MARMQRLLALLATVHLATAQNGSHFKTIPVYPSPPMTGNNEAEAVMAATNDFISRLTLEEKSSLVDGTDGPCGGNIAPIPRLKFKGICLQDSPVGVREADFVTIFPAGITAGASFDKVMIRERGRLMAEEFRAKGINIALTPVAGPLGRSALGGRNWEGFGADPYLSGIAVSETIAAFKELNVQTTIKHFVGNEQETMRNPTMREDGVIIQNSVNSNIDDRTMHELYMWPFADAIRAGADHAMCSYQQLNQTYACSNPKALNGLLKGELGFQGSVFSDWFATHSGVASINAGLDLNMPGGRASPYFMNMSQFVENGDVSKERLDDMVRRILTPYFRQKQKSPDYPALDLSLNEFKTQSSMATGNNILLPATPDELPMWNIGGTKNRDVRKDHGKFVRDLGAAGAVLLKNDGALPFKALKNIAVYGNDAADLSEGQFALDPIGPIGPKMGANAQGGGSGTGRFSYLVSPLQAIKERMGSGLVQYILDNDAIPSNIGSIYPAPEACLVFVKSFIGEATDRKTLDFDWDGNAIIDIVSQKCNNTVVVTHTGGPNNMPWADNPNITEIIAGHLPGQEIGHSIADILWGDVNPSGKLPYTIARDESDYNAPVVNLTGSVGIDAWQADFTEGLYTDYRHFDKSGIEPLYEFGFGLSYTTFSLKLVSVTKLVSNASAMPPSRPTQPGGNPALFEALVSVTVTVENTGKLAGATVPQLYVSLPDSAPRGTPVKVLRGFDKTKKLLPNQSQKISFVLTRKDMSFWDVIAQDWRIPKGRFSLKVGFSSRDLPVKEFMTF
ncbi:putative beta-glucosidase G [Fusarium venenatum]|uniref:Beta-glucosidase cel3A n=1 Tax=Fusarium venenatum TaxID=56646 RepID=A0A2L2TK41_9HYPO|nr:uncharacterized protein FVRRES_10486 [Fusarium venenatum]KAG8361057.1 putative beta-glucosidase G [Fusarium venenatum]KAH6967088.1 beta-glucosidase [Fusarium venenatum]CEI70409.1 unnamed protein product [Fusarium venenatum]